MDASLAEYLIEIINRNSIVLIIVAFLAVALIFYGGLQSRKDREKRNLHAQEAARAAIESVSDFPFGEPLDDLTLQKRLSDMMGAPGRPTAQKPPPLGEPE